MQATLENITFFCAKIDRYKMLVMSDTVSGAIATIGETTSICFAPSYFFCQLAVLRSHVAGKFGVRQAYITFVFNCSANTTDMLSNIEFCIPRFAVLKLF